MHKSEALPDSGISLHETSDAGIDLSHAPHVQGNLTPEETRIIVDALLKKSNLEKILSGGDHHIH